MTTAIRIGLAVAATVLTFGGAAFAQGASVDTRTRGSGAAGTTPGGIGSTLSGSSSIGGRVTTPGVGADVRGRTTGGGAIGIGRGGAGGNVGAGGKAETGVRIGR